MGVKSSWNCKWVAEKEGKKESRVNNVKFKQSGEEEMLPEEIENHKNVGCGYFESLEQKMPRSAITMKPKPVKSTAHSRNPNPLPSHRDNFTPYVSPVISAHYIYTHMQIKLY